MQHYKKIKIFPAGKFPIRGSKPCCKKKKSTKLIGLEYLIGTYEDRKFGFFDSLPAHPK
jgi:hypothetical protein